MFAVIRTGGKQYRVTANQRLEVERLAGEPGAQLRLGQVLMIGDEAGPPLVGAPLLEQAAVFAEVVEQKRGAKILVFKKKRRHKYRRCKGHRQELTVLRITGISPTGDAPEWVAVSAAPAESEAEAQAPEASEAAPPEGGADEAKE